MTSLALTKNKHLIPFAAFAINRGIVVHRLLKQANLPLDSLENPEALVPAICIAHFRALVANKAESKDISIEVTRQFKLENMGAVGRDLSMEPTLRTLLDKFQEFVSTETSNVVIELCLQPTGDLWFGQRIMSHTEFGEWHSYLYVICWMLNIVQLTDPAWFPTEILIVSEATSERYEAIEKTRLNGPFPARRYGLYDPRIDAGPASDEDSCRNRRCRALVEYTC